MKQLYAIKTKRSVAGLVFDNGVCVDAPHHYAWALAKTLPEVKAMLNGTYSKVFEVAREE
jgi:hypothetical protein